MELRERRQDPAPTIKSPTGKKRALSLLETLIGFILFSLILSVLFSSLREGLSLKKETSTIGQTIYQKQYIQERLSSLFLTTPPPSTEHPSPLYMAPYPPVDSIRHHISHSQPSKALYFLFDNGLDPDPQFCGLLQGILTLAPSDSLLTEESLADPSIPRRDTREQKMGSPQAFVLIITPLPKEKNTSDPHSHLNSYPTPIRREVLFQGVEKIEYTFFSLPTKPQGEKKRSHTWEKAKEDKSQDTLPSFIELQLFPEEHTSPLHPHPHMAPNVGSGMEHSEYYRFTFSLLSSTPLFYPTPLSPVKTPLGSFSSLKGGQ